MLLISQPASGYLDPATLCHPVTALQTLQTLACNARPDVNPDVLVMYGALLCSPRGARCGSAG